MLVRDVRIGGRTLPARGVSAHRGGSANAPENTLAAFRAGVAAGAAQLEFDLRRCASGEIVVIHDERVDRTTDGSGAVSELPLAALRELDAGRHFDAAFAGERIPTLDEVLESTPRDVWLNIQVKFKEPLAADAARQIVAHNRLAQAFLACGNAAAREARAVDPRVQICNLVRQADRDAYVDHAVATGADFIQLHHLRGPPESALVSRAHRSGLRVNYLCDPSASLRALDAVMSSGVDFPLVMDVPAAVARVGHRETQPSSMALARV